MRQSSEPRPGPGTPGGETARPALSDPALNPEGEPFGREGTNQTLPEPDDQAPRPELPEHAKHVENTPYLR